MLLTFVCNDGARRRCYPPLLSDDFENIRTRARRFFPCEKIACHSNENHRESTAAGKRFTVHEALPKKRIIILCFSFFYIFESRIRPDVIVIILLYHVHDGRAFKHAVGTYCFRPKSSNQNTSGRRRAHNPMHRSKRNLSFHHNTFFWKNKTVYKPHF